MNSTHRHPAHPAMPAKPRLERRLGVGVDRGAAGRVFGGIQASWRSCVPSIGTDEQGDRAP